MIITTTSTEYNFSFDTKEKEAISTARIILVDLCRAMQERNCFTLECNSHDVDYDFGEIEELLILLEDIKEADRISE